jgi:uncharacterized membrane protein YdbT with pleckstrin-like domain
VAYVDRVLQPGEAVRVRGHLHWIIFLQPLLLTAVAIVIAAGTWFALTDQTLRIVGYVVAALLAGVALVGFIRGMIVKATTEFAVTDHRIIVKRGFISLHTVEMNVDKVESVDVDQTIAGRLLGYGEVTVHGVGARWDPIAGIADPLGFRTAITARGTP